VKLRPELCCEGLVSGASMGSVERPLWVVGQPKPPGGELPEAADGQYFEFLLEFALCVEQEVVLRAVGLFFGQLASRAAMPHDSVADSVVLMLPGRNVVQEFFRVPLELIHHEGVDALQIWLSLTP
jgi:hypothetical protein